jgi:phosphopentomutase
LPPPRNVIDILTAHGKQILFIGKTCELFPNREGITRNLTTNNAAHDAALTEAAMHSNADFIFANLEDFDMLYGHRNDSAGFAKALEDFDNWLERDFIPHLRPTDIVGITADHGNDPTTPSTDHSREYAPLLLFGGSVKPREISGHFSDWGATVCDYLDVPYNEGGSSLL